MQYQTVNVGEEAEVCHSASVRSVRGGTVQHNPEELQFTTTHQSCAAQTPIEECDEKLTMFAVGDDDQNIYAFNGSSTEFIRRFEADYEARPAYLTDNYRSTGHIIAAANAVIEPARQRMKEGREIEINRARAQDPPGGDWTLVDPVALGPGAGTAGRRQPGRPGAGGHGRTEAAV